MSRNHTPIGIALRLFCAALVVALGFAHRPMAAPAVPMEMAAYMLPDGTLPILCLPEHQHDPSGKDMGPRCEACRISAAILLPAAPCDAIAVAPASERTAFAGTPERFHRLHFPPNALPRGPPAIAVSSLIA